MHIPYEKPNWNNMLNNMTEEDLHSLVSKGESIVFEKRIDIATFDGNAELRFLNANQVEAVEAFILYILDNGKLYRNFENKYDKYDLFGLQKKLEPQYIQSLQPCCRQGIYDAYHAMLWELANKSQYCTC